MHDGWLSQSLQVVFRRRPQDPDLAEILAIAERIDARSEQLKPATIAAAIKAISEGLQA